MPAVPVDFVLKRRAATVAVREIPQSAMAVSAGLGALMLDQGRVGVQWMRHYKRFAISIGNKNGLGYQSTFDNNKNGLVPPCVNSSAFKLSLAIRYLGALVHIAALRGDLPFFMRECAIGLVVRGHSAAPP